MKVDMLMPRLGESITEGTIVKWLKSVGDSVKKDEPLLEISTDKVDSEIPSPFEGTILEIKANENDTVEVDVVIAVIETEAGEAVKAASKSTDSAPASPVEKGASVASADTNAGNDGQQQPADAGKGAEQAVEMPKLGESITEGNIVKWLKSEGDMVKKDEPLLEISTDKVDSEIPSPFEGKLTKIVVPEGETVAVGAVIAHILSSSGGSASIVSASSSKKTEAKERTSNGATHEVESPVLPSGDGGAVPARSRGGRFYSPLVRSIARKEGITRDELEAINGTGVEGRVTKRDIVSYLENDRFKPQSDTPVIAKPQKAPQQAARPAAPGEVADKYQGKRVEVLPMDNIRKKIADHMVMSKHTSPHVYGVAEVDFTNVMNIVKKHREAWQKKENMKLTVNPIILFCVAKSANDFPGVNASIDGHNIVNYQYLNLGMAVATERGLMVPVLKNADEMNFRGIARNAYDLAIRTRDRKITPDDISGSTLTVTNYGVFGNMIGFPIINQPNVAIMGVGAVKKRPVVIETEFGDQIGIRQIGYLTLSYDHRIVDGELGDNFLQRVRYYLENFQEEWL